MCLREITKKMSSRGTQVLSLSRFHFLSCWVTINYVLVTFCKASSVGTSELEVRECLPQKWTCQDRSLAHFWVPGGCYSNYDNTFSSFWRRWTRKDYYVKASRKYCVQKFESPKCSRPQFLKWYQQTELPITASPRSTQQVVQLDNTDCGTQRWYWVWASRVIGELEFDVISILLEVPHWLQGKAKSPHPNILGHCLQNWTLSFSILWGPGVWQIIKLCAVASKPVAFLPLLGYLWMFLFQGQGLCCSWGGIAWLPHSQTMFLI